MSSYGNTLKTDTLEVKDVFATDVHSSGTIYWTNFSPAIGGGGGGGGSQNLATTLATGNDANNLNITNLNDLACQNVNASVKVTANDLVATDEITSNKFTGTGVNPTISGINNIATNNIAAVSSITCTSLTASSQVNSSDTVNGLKGNFSTSVTTPITDTAKVTHTAPVKVTSIQMLGDIDLQDDATPAVKHDIKNVNLITATGATVTGAQVGLLNATNINASPAITLNSVTGLDAEMTLNTSVVGQSVSLKFTGEATSIIPDTFIRGDNRLIAGTQVNTKCLNLDLTDPTNVIPESQGDYRWGMLYAPNQRQTKESDDESATVFNENCFFDWSSTISSHSTCFFNLQFFIEEYGYGDIQLMFFYQKSDLSGSRTIFPNSQQFFMPTESGTLFRQVRKVGVVGAQFLLQNLPTTGEAYRFWPAVRTNFDSEGRCIIAMRNYNGDPNNDNEIGSPVTVEVYPAPPTSRFRIVN